MIGGWVIAAAAGRPAAVATVDSPSGRFRCHAQAPRDRDRCAQVVVWADEAYAAQVERLGFRGPVPDRGEGGSDAVDLYLTREAGGAEKAWVDCDGGDPHCLDPDPGDGRATAPAYVVIDPRTPGRVFRHFVHHELSHVWQYATDYAEPELALWEGTAAACERWTDPTWTTSASDLADFQRAPWLSALFQDGGTLAELRVDRDSWFEYGAAAWVTWLDATQGDGHGSVGPRLWEEVAGEGRGLLDGWDAVTGDWRAAFLDFTEARARMGTPEGPAWTAFAGRRARARRERMHGTVLEPRHAPFPLGASFVDLVGPVEVAVAGDPGVDWAVLAIGPGARQDLGATGGRVTLEGPFTLAVVSLGPPSGDPATAMAPAGFRLTIEREQAGARPTGQRAFTTAPRGP